MLLDYKFASHFLPGFHSDNDKNSIKLVTRWGNVNKGNDKSKSMWETVICSSFNFPNTGPK